MDPKDLGEHLAALRRRKGVGLRELARQAGLSAAALSAVDDGRIRAEGVLDLRREPERIVLRFRHPTKAPLRGVIVNGKAHKHFTPFGDVDLTGRRSQLTVDARY